MERALIILVLSLCGLQTFGSPVERKPVDSDHANRKDSVMTDTFDFFDSDQVLEMTLSFDMKKFFGSRNKPEYMKAAMEIRTDEEVTGLRDSVKIKARGNMRRLYCQFPPVMLKFKNDSSGIPYSGKLKMVMPCMNSEKYTGYVLKEYLVYRLFNLLSPYSFKTRLIKIKMTDSKSDKRAYSFYAFLIESEQSLAQRNNAQMITNANLGQRNMETDFMARVAVFNYMVGNTDWSIPMQHNVRIFTSKENMSDKGIPVVYDFDYAGLVNPPYATPAKELPITEVKERYYLGLCSYNAELEKAVNDFEDLREDILGTVSGFNYLTGYDKKTTESYVSSFYKMMRNKEALINTLSKTCK